VSRWLQTEPPVENTQLYKNREGGRELGHMGNQLFNMKQIFEIYNKLDSTN
jgi:hypothetical protein